MESRWFSASHRRCWIFYHFLSKHMFLSVTKSTAAVNKPVILRVCKYCPQNKVNCIKPGAFTQSVIPGLSAGTCIRKQLLFIQLFACFPLMGIVIPNALLILTDAQYILPLLHWVLCTCLLMVIISTFIIQFRYSAYTFYKREVHITPQTELSDKV